MVELLLFLSLFVVQTASADSFLDAGPLEFMPTFSLADKNNPLIIENQFSGVQKDIYRALRRKTVFLPKDGKWLMASILSADEFNNTAEDIALLKQARQTVFESFNQAFPNYTQAQWERVSKADPLFRPDTYVIVIQDPDTKSVIGNMKLVYDHPDHPLPAEEFFPNIFQRSAPIEENVKVFNVVQGAIQTYTKGPVGGAIQVMELFGRGYTAELFFLANFILSEHRKVKYRHNGILYETYPREIISYADESEMSSYHTKVGLKVVARHDGYVLDSMPLGNFQKAYKNSVLFRPGSKKLQQTGMVYQTSPLTYFFVRNIFDTFSAEDTFENQDIINAKLKRAEQILAEAKKNGVKPDHLVEQFHEYYTWATKPRSSCMRFYE